LHSAAVTLRYLNASVASVGAARSRTWRTSSPVPIESSSAASDVSLARFGLRIIRAMQPSAARGKTAECVAKRKRASSFSGEQSDRQLSAGARSAIGIGRIGADARS
jgi:hypothetical protein